MHHHSFTLRLTGRVLRAVLVRAVLMTLSLGLVCTASQAAGSNGRRTIVQVTVHDTGHVIATLDSDGEQVESCTTRGNQSSILLDKNDPRFKNMYAMLLLAYSTKTPIGGWVNGCVDLWGDGTNKFPRMLTLALVP